MLNISDNEVRSRIDTTRFRSFAVADKLMGRSNLARLLLMIVIVFLIFMFLPWTQTVYFTGKVTTLDPGLRPQDVPSVIAGRIEKWYVREGDYVQKGDTILFISEIKDDYFDPQLLGRTQEQIDAKAKSVGAYRDKAAALEQQIAALIQNREVKSEQAVNYIRQAELKVVSDSMDWRAAVTQLEIAAEQFRRAEELFASGLRSRTDYEARQLKLREAEAKEVSAENKFQASRTELTNAQAQLEAVRNEFADKLAKSESDKFSALSSMYESQGMVSKLNNQFANYSVRKGMYFITAPQEGYLTGVTKQGVGETVKEGESLATIMPKGEDLALEIFVSPVDVPLMHPDEDVRIMFDGWPAFVFSGWPDASFGVFSGKVTTIENFAGENGKFRVWVKPDLSQKRWPEGLRYGTGATGITLLEDVPVWYELWRKLNGFPPEFYDEGQNKPGMPKQPKPVKMIK